MPHYKDGTEAKIGDVVKGKGYNIKHEITGVVVGLKVGEKVCNVTVATITRDVYTNLTLPVVVKDGKVEALENGSLNVPATFEYGQADAFEKIG